MFLPTRVREGGCKAAVRGRRGKGVSEGGSLKGRGCEGSGEQRHSQGKKREAGYTSMKGVVGSPGVARRERGEREGGSADVACQQGTRHQVLLGFLFKLYWVVLFIWY